MYNINGLYEQIPFFEGYRLELALMCTIIVWLLLLVVTHFYQSHKRKKGEDYQHITAMVLPWSAGLLLAIFVMACVSLITHLALL